MKMFAFSAMTFNIYDEYKAPEIKLSCILYCCLPLETTVILRDEARLWPGTYKVVVQIKDQQGKSCDDVQMIDVIVCTCNENTKTCLSRSTTTKSFGASGVLLLLLGLLLLLCE